MPHLGGWSGSPLATSERWLLGPGHPEGEPKIPPLSRPDGSKCNAPFQEGPPSFGEDRLGPAHCFILVVVWTSPIVGSPGSPPTSLGPGPQICQMMMWALTSAWWAWGFTSLLNLSAANLCRLGLHPPRDAQGHTPFLSLVAPRAPPFTSLPQHPLGHEALSTFSTQLP